jgi:hypothetical protein
MLIKVKGGTHNKTDAKNKMHKSRRKILDVMNGETRKDTFGYRETQDDRNTRISREEAKNRAKYDMFNEIKVPTFCPQCKKFMKNKFDTKFYFRTGQCFDCQQDFEHKLRVTGIYPLWERIKVFENEISILKEQRVKFLEALDSDSAISEMVNSDGAITTFEFAGRWDDIKQELVNEIAFVDDVLPPAETELVRMRIELKEKDIENIVEQDSIRR